MEHHADMKMLTLRHFLFYIGLAALVGAGVGAAAGLMDWSIGLVYVVGLPAGILVFLAAVRESFNAPVRSASGQRRHGRHA